MKKYVIGLTVGHVGVFAKNTLRLELSPHDDWSKNNVVNSPVALPRGDVLLQDNMVYPGGLIAPWKSKKKTNFAGTSEGNGVAAKDSKGHDAVDKGGSKAPSKPKKKPNSNGKGFQRARRS